jgi:hypothetical protein
MRKTLTWIPRILGILFALFTSLFALDAFDGPQSIWLKIVGFLIHLLPVYFLVAGVWLGWKRPWLGGIIFLGFALWYVVTFLGPTRRVDAFALVIFALLPALLGLLFLVDGWLRRTFNAPPAGKVGSA